MCFPVNFGRSLKTSSFIDYIQWLLLSVTRCKASVYINKYSVIFIHKIFKYYTPAKRPITDIWLDYKYTSVFFWTAIWLCPSANFQPLSRGQPHSPGVNHIIVTYLTWKSPGSLKQGCVPKSNWVPSGVWTENFLILITMP